MVAPAETLDIVVLLSGWTTCSTTAVRQTHRCRGISRTCAVDQPPSRWQVGPVAATAARREHVPMTTKLHTFRRLVSGLVAEDRSGFKRLAAPAARYDAGSWLKNRWPAASPSARRAVRPASPRRPAPRAARSSPARGRM